jgi:uncharacterized membrane protein
MSSRHLCLVVLTGLAWAGPVVAQQIVTLPVGSWANDVTPDGEVVVGTYNFGDGFIWRWRVDPSPTVVVGGDMLAVSDDGTVVCGNIPDPGGSGLKVAGRWTAVTGWESLGFLPGTPELCGDSLSSAYDISGDGTTIVGLAWDGSCSGRGFLWTEATGLQPLQNLANGGNRCSAISGDGSALGGFAQGSASRTPAYWAPDTSGFAPNPAIQGEVWGFNETGSKSVGSMYFSGASYSAFIRDAQSGVFTNLGKLQSTWAGIATDLSEDNTIIVGFDNFSLARKAWVWTAADGIKSLKDRLTALGVVVPGNPLVCRAVSDDGSVIVGGGDTGIGGPFDVAAFIAEIPVEPSAWTSLLGGLAGVSGIPQLSGTGPLTAGSPTSVVLSQGKPSAPAAFVIGLSAGNLPFKQGVLVPQPNQLLPIPALSTHGAVGLSFNWPASVPGAFELYWQCLIADPAAPAGVALSNALRSLTP